MRHGAKLFVLSKSVFHMLKRYNNVSMGCTSGSPDHPISQHSCILQARCTGYVSSNTYIRPTLEYCSVIWPPGKQSNIDIIEGVQRFFTKRLVRLWNISYSERLIACGIQSLELRRLKTDMILVYKIVHGLISLDIDKYFFLTPWDELEDII